MATSSMVLIEPDAFLGVGEEVSSYIPRYGEPETEEAKEARLAKATSLGFDLSDITTVSRPLNGIAVKPDTHAWVQVLRDDGTPILLFNALGQTLGESESGFYASKPVVEQAAGGRVSDRDLTEAAETSAHATANASAQGVDSPGPSNKPNSAAWTDWILQSVREQRVEKTQVVETFGDTYFYAFGERPRALEFTGLLMNTLDYNWRAIFWENWDRFFRATKLIEAGARMYIGWEDIIVEGYPINAAASETADSPNAMTFRFTFYITNYINTSSQAGYVSQRNERTARIRGGYIGGAKTGKSSNLDRNFWSVDLLGPRGATEAGIWARGGSESSFAKWGGYAVAQLVDGAAKALLRTQVSPGAASAFLTNFTRQFAHNTAKYFTDQMISAAEKEKRYAPGEINAWFGLIGTLATKMDHGSKAQELALKGGTTARTLNSKDSLKNPNWLGKRAGFDVNMITALKTGSLDRIIGAMAYSIPSFPGYQDNTAYDSSYSEGKPAAATMVQMTSFEDLAPASEILPGLEPGIAGGDGGGAIPGGGTVTRSDLSWEPPPGETWQSTT